MSDHPNYDIIVVGAGCAGMTASVYAARAGKTVLMLEGTAIGGQISSSPRVENYPGISSISGPDFSDALFQQTAKLGVEFLFDSASALKPQADGSFVVDTAFSGSFAAGSVILATGSGHRKLNVPGEERLSGRGVSYCAICDGSFFRGKSVVVVGGGLAALQSAEYLCGVCDHVTLIHRLNAFRREAALAERVQTNQNLTVLLNSSVTEICGEHHVESVLVKDWTNGQIAELPTAGVFVAQGQIPVGSAPFVGLIDTDEAGYYKAGEDCRTNLPGVFAAGDCRTKTVRQLTTAAGDGSVAALAACAWVDEH